MAESHREEIAKLEALYAGNPGGRVFVHLAEAYRKAGEHERARRILEDGLARHPDSASGYVVLGRVLADMQIGGEAESAFRRVLELDSGNLVALRWLGDLARQSGRPGEAVSHYRELLARNPSNEEVRELVEIVEREGADAAAAREAPQRNDLIPAADELEITTSDDSAALTEPAQAGAAEPGDVTPLSAAPGSTGEVESPEVEYGVVDLGDVPGGDGYELPAEPAPHEAVESTMSSDDVIPAYEADIVSELEEGDVLELDEMSRDEDAEPAAIHLLDPAWESEAVEADEAVELDLSDMAAAAAEGDEGEYASDEFIADLLNVPDEPDPEELGTPDLNVFDRASPLTLLGDEPVEPVEETVELTEVSLTSLSGAVEPAAEASFDVRAAEAASPALDDSPQAADEAFGETAAAEAEPEPVVEGFPPDPAVDGPEPVQTGVDDLVLEEGAEAYAGDEADAEPETVPSVEPLTARAPEPAPARAAEPRVGESGLMTETMALLYRSQGFHDRAAEVYRALLKQRPDDERLKGRLREAEEAAGIEEAPGDDEAGEVWLRGVGAWTPEAAEPTDATPYAWAAEAEEAEPGEPIVSYLQELVAWKPGQATESRNAAAEAPAPGAADTAAAQSSWSSAPWETAAVSPEEAASAWSSSAADAAAEELDSWVPRSAGQDQAPAAADGAAEELDSWVPKSAGQEDIPADPWLQGSVDEPAAAEPAAADDAGGWTPFDMDDDASSSGVPANTPPPEQPEVQHDDLADDEDLEMFRSWLQSLKK